MTLPVCTVCISEGSGNMVFLSEKTLPYSIPVYAKVTLLVTASVALDIHEVTKQPWISANVNGLLSSSLVYVSSFPAPQGCIGCSAVVSLYSLPNYEQSCV